VWAPAAADDEVDDEHATLAAASASAAAALRSAGDTARRVPGGVMCATFIELQ